MKTAKGTFDIEIAPQDDGPHAVGRFILNKAYVGNMKGQGLGQMISHRIEGGLSIYYAIETVTAEIDGQSGSFVLCHEGVMDAQQQKLDIQVLPGSGTGAFRGMRGHLDIIQNEAGHAYELTYQLPEQ